MTEPAPSAPVVVSVVIPTRDRAAVVPRAVRSVLAQEGPALEVVVVDDGSTDDTANVIDSFDDPRVRAVHQPPSGVAAARNHGARIATGDVLVFLDDDDDVDPSWLRSLTGPFDDESIALVSCGSIHRRGDGSVVHELPVRDLGPAFDHLHAQFDTGTYAVRRAAFDAAGGFAVGLTSGEHHELGMRLVDVFAEHGWRSTFVPESLVTVSVRAAIDRASNNPRSLLDSSRYLLDHHRERLERSPRLLANYFAIAGVSAARLGDFREARSYLARAVRANPTRLKHAGRWLLAAVPVVGRRVWRADQWRERAL